MHAVRDLLASNAPLALSVGGLLIGCAFGATVLASNYCTMGALSDIRNLRDFRRFRAWVLAAATAILGTQLLQLFAVVPLERSMYLPPTLNWAGHIVGGLLLGFGMVFAGGCPSRNLARAGSGDLRSLLSLLVLGLVAYMTTGGIFAYPRVYLEQATELTLSASTQSLGELLGRRVGLSRPAGDILVATAFVLAAGAYCFADRAFRASRRHVFSGLAIGMIVVAGWALTGLAYEEMATRPLAPVSLSYVRPTGDAIEWLTRFSAAPLPGFGAASVLGALIGAFAVAQRTGRFRIATYADRSDTLRNLSGAALMGIGGVLGLGCTIGQAVTGVSTLALGSFLTFAAIVVGGICGLIVLERQVAADGAAGAAAFPRRPTDALSPRQHPTTAGNSRQGRAL
jgi:uncharacterized protein